MGSPPFIVSTGVSSKQEKSMNGPKLVARSERLGVEAEDPTLVRGRKHEAHTARGDQPVVETLQPLASCPLSNQQEASYREGRVPQQHDKQKSPI